MSYKKCGCSDATVITQADAVPILSQPAGNSCGAVPSMLPYYATDPACFQDHGCDYPANVYGSIKIENSFNMPQCSGSAELEVKGVAQVLVGSYLWNPSYGFLKVIGFSAERGIINVQNDCQSGNASPGYQIPGCSLFAVTGPPNSSISGGSSDVVPYLATDFVAPANGQEVVVNVSNVNGLVTNKNVTLAAGTYRIDAIINSTTVRLANDGLGLPSGTTVFARNGANELQYPLTPIDVNPCSNDVVTNGQLLVCNTGVTQPLKAFANGSVPVVTDYTTNKVEFQILQIPTRTCTALTQGAVHSTGNPNVIYTVQDTSIFTVGNVLQAGTRTDRFTITNILDGTHLQGTISPTPGAIENIPVGTSLCTIDAVEAVTANVNANRSTVSALTSVALTPAALPIGAGNFVDGNAVELLIQNTSPSKKLSIIVNVGYYSEYTPVGSPGNFQRVALAPMIGFAQGSIGSTTSPALVAGAREQRTTVIPTGDTASHEGPTLFVSDVFSLNPGTELRARSLCRIESGGGSVSSCTVNVALARMTILGVGVSP